jgi:hypothetical protein
MLVGPCYTPLNTAHLRENEGRRREKMSEKKGGRREDEGEGGRREGKRKENKVAKVNHTCITTSNTRTQLVMVGSCNTSWM